MEKLCRKRMIRVGILLTLAILSITGVFTKFQQKVILPPAENYVEQSQEKALAAFITISVVKGLVAVIEGSDVVGIEVGDIVQPLYDAIDITWKLITASLASLYAIEVLLKLCTSLSTFFLSILFILLLLFQFTRKDTVKKAAYFTGILVFTFFLAIPLTLFISGKFSDSYSKPVREEFDLKMAEFETEYKARLSELQEGDLITLEGGDISLTNIQLPDINFPKFHLIKAIFTDMAGLIEELPDLLLRTGVSWLLDVIIVPIGLLLLLYKLAMLFTEALFGELKAEKLNRTLKKHLEKLKPTSISESK